MKALLVVTLLSMGPAFCTCGAQELPPPTMAQVWTLNATYRDPAHGVTFRYPSAWKATTQYAYHVPALTGSDVAKPIAGYGYSVGGFPREHAVGPYTNTNLEGFGIVYSAVSTESTSACDAIASRLSRSHRIRHVVFGGRSFAKYRTVDAGMSQGIEGHLYATFNRHTCYLFETDYAAAYAVEDVKYLSPAETKAIEGHLLEIMKSVRIVPVKR